MSDDDIYFQNQEESRQKIADLQHQKNIKGCYDVGYHSGLITGIENKQSQSMLIAFCKGLEQAKQKHRKQYEEQAREVYKKMIKKV